MDLIILILGLIACAAAVTLVARSLAAGRVRTADSLGQIGDYGYVATVEPVVTGARGPLSGALDRLAVLVGSMFGWADDTKLRAELMAAAMYTTAPAKVTGFRIMGVVLLPLLWLWLAMTAAAPLPVTVVGALFMVAFGWLMPISMVRRRAEDRINHIEREMPDLMDLLVVTVEAGMSFNASLKVAAERLHGPLGDELRLTLQEQSLGLSLEDALRNLLMRCNARGVRSFVRSVLQGETLGVSIGQIMRNLAEEIRAQRKADAEERAQKAPVKMLFPLIFLIFPAMFVVLLTPAAVDFFNAFHGG